MGSLLSGFQSFADSIYMIEHHSTGDHTVSAHSGDLSFPVARQFFTLSKYAQRQINSVDFKACLRAALFHLIHQTRDHHAETQILFLQSPEETDYFFRGIKDYQTYAAIFRFFHNSIIIKGCKGAGAPVFSDIYRVKLPGDFEIAAELWAGTLYIEPLRCHAEHHIITLQAFYSAFPMQCV